MNEKQKPYVFGGLICGAVLGVLIGFFPEEVNSNPILKAVAIVLMVPASIVSFWFLTEMLKSSSDR
jgi:hypothetical protein